jgi:RNA polymerase sigma-70 factor (ECF subfamily)
VKARPPSGSRAGVFCAPAKGKFRAFRLASISNEWDRARAIKRGGGTRSISFRERDPERRYRCEPVDNATAEKIYERRWTLTLPDEVLHFRKQI